MAQQLKSDWLLFGTVVAMVGVGLVMVYSASSVVAQLNPHINSSFYYAAHQLVWAAVSFVALMFFKRRDYRMLQSPGWAFGSLGMVLFLQLLVFFLDSKTHRWFRLQGVGTLQPSEFAKPALIIFFAYFVTQKREAINTRRTIVAASLALAVLAATVGLGDLGTAIVLIVPAAVVFYVAGLERKFVRGGARGRARWSPSDLSLPNPIAWRASWDSSIPTTNRSACWIPTARSRNTSANR